VPLWFIGATFRKPGGIGSAVSGRFPYHYLIST
jgi:hypothetical protein